jgi:hypothetical protein
MVSSRVAKLRSEMHQKRGKISEDEKEAQKSEGASVGPLVLGILLFVVIGSVVLQIVQNTRNAAMHGVHANADA